MATFYDQSALDALLDVISSEATKVVLLDTYTQGQPYATVVGNVVAEANISGADFSGPSDNGEDRRITFNGKTGVATSDSSANDLHVGIISASKVLAVTNETTDQQITDTNPVEFNSFYLEARQPTQA